MLTWYTFSKYVDKAERVNKSKSSKTKKGNSREESSTSALLLLLLFFFFFSWKNLKNKNAQVRILGELLALSFSLCVCVIFHFTGYIYIKRIDGAISLATEMSFFKGSSYRRHYSNNNDLEAGGSQSDVKESFSSNASGQFRYPLVRKRLVRDNSTRVIEFLEPCFLEHSLWL